MSGPATGKAQALPQVDVVLDLDADILEWFKAKQGGKRGYQTAINAALRKVVEEEMRKAG